MHSIFADTDDSRAWLDLLETVSEEDADRVQVPDAETWRNWLTFVEVPDEDIEHVISTTPSPDSDPQLYRILQRGAAHLISYMGQMEYPTKFAPLRDCNNPQSRYFYVQLLAACLPFTRAYHRSVGIPDEITQATVADLGRNIRVHRKREGVGGLGVMWWLMLHFRGMIFQLGRLQLEFQHVGEGIADSIRASASGREVDETTHALSIHIPDFMGSMDHDACTESIVSAMEFFARYYPDWHVDYAVCNSWLLDPHLEEYLRPESNIIRFQKRFTIVETDGESNDSVMQFVFGKHVRDMDTITPRSSLERGVIEHLRSGKNWKFTPGWFDLSTYSSQEHELR